MTKTIIIIAFVSIAIGAAFLSIMVWSHNGDSQTPNPILSAHVTPPAATADNPIIKPRTRHTSLPSTPASISVPKQEEPQTRSFPPVTLNNDRISIQTATQQVCRQAGINYQWQRSYDATQPDCRRYIKVHLSDMMIENALNSIVTSNGLTYRMEGTNVWLERAE